MRLGGPSGILRRTRRSSMRSATGSAPWQPETDPPAAQHQRPRVRRRAGGGPTRSRRAAAMARIPRARILEKLRAQVRAASRSSAAAPARGSRPSARRKAASTSSSFTTRAAIAWPGAARSPACWPTATPTRSCSRWRARCCRWSSTRRCSRASTAPTRSCCATTSCARLGELGFSGVQNFPDGRHHRRRVPRQPRGDRHGLRRSRSR